MLPFASTLGGVLASALLGVPAAEASPQGIPRQLVCRGAPDIDLRFDKDPSPLDPRYIRFVLRYKPGQRPVGTEFQSMLPGHCSWNRFDQNDVPVEPGLVYFDVPRYAIGEGWPVPDTSVKAAELYPDRTTVPRYLKEPSHYWSFYVDDVSHFSGSNGPIRFTYRPPVGHEGTIAVDSGPKTIDRAGTTRGTRPDLTPRFDAAHVPLTFREVVRRPNEYWIRFSARAKANATVQYSRTPPVNVGGKLTLQSPIGWPVRLGEERNFTAEYSTAPLRNLPIGTKYYFLIRVPASGSLPAQEYSGEFDTLIQTVVVRFTRIKVLNDGDKGSPGELGFSFHVARNTTPDASCLVAGDNCWETVTNLSWETGSDNAISVPELRLERAPNRIRVWVAGFESDRYNSDRARPRKVYYTYNTGSDVNGDTNNARAEYDLSTLPDNGRLAFTLRSVDGFVLMYEVHGEIQVIRR